MKEILINDIPVVSCSYEAAANDIAESAILRKTRIFMHYNLYNYYILTDRHKTLTSHPYIRAFLEGTGMSLGCKYSRIKLEGLVNGTDLFPLLFEKLSAAGGKIYILGGKPGTLEEAVMQIMSNYPELQIAGYRHGYFAVEEEQKITEEINRLSSGLLILCMGMDKEAGFISRNHSLIEAGSIWAAGGLLDFLSGRLPRAPKLMRRLGMEWLFRLFLEPGKKLKRCTVIPLLFFYKLLVTKKIKIV